MGNNSESSDTSDTESLSLKRKKAPTLTAAEKALLRELVQEKISIIESKSTSPKIIVMKQKAWDEIAVVFNSKPENSMRSHIKLKKAWENMKSATKKEVAAVKRKKMKTGGGEAVPDLSLQASMICGMIPNQMKPLENQWDSDEIGLILPKKLRNSDESILNPEDTFIDKDDTINFKEPVSAELKDKRLFSSATADSKSSGKEERKKQSMDKRSFVIQMEEEQHILNMKILQKKLEVEDLQILRLKNLMEQDVREHSRRMELIDVQITQAKGTCIYAVDQPL